MQAVNSIYTAEKERGIAGSPLSTKRESQSSWVTPGHQRLRSIPGHQRLLVYTRGEASYSHEWPLCGERFLGWYTPDERFLGRLRVWRLGKCDPRFWNDSGQRLSSNRPVSGMSKTVGGHSARLRAAASGGAASTSSRMSGRAVHGRG